MLLRCVATFSDLPKKGRMLGWFLFLSYFIGCPAFILMEYRSNVLTEMFGYYPAFIYFTKVTQFICSLLLLSKRFRQWSLGILTIMSIGATLSFLKTTSPLAGLPAAGYTLLQVWFGMHLYLNASREDDITTPHDK